MDSNEPPNGSAARGTPIADAMDAWFSEMAASPQPLNPGSSAPPSEAPAASMPPPDSSSAADAVSTPAATKPAMLSMLDADDPPGLPNGKAPQRHSSGAPDGSASSSGATPRVSSSGGGGSKRDAAALLAAQLQQQVAARSGVVGSIRCVEGSYPRLLGVYSKCMRRGASSKLIHVLCFSAPPTASSASPSSCTVS